jgi:hypothetical protein
MNGMLIQLDDDSLDMVSGGGTEFVIDPGAVATELVNAGVGAITHVAEFAGGVATKIAEHLPIITISTRG